MTLSEFQLMVLEKEKITCDDVAELMGDYADGELIPTLEGRLNEHIAECFDCQDLREQYLLTIELAREIGRRPPPVPTGVQNRLRAALNARLGLNLGSAD